MRRVKMRSKRARRAALRRLVGAPAIGLEIAVEPPDQRADAALGGALLVGEGVELVDQALGMDPAQGVVADIELAGVVADDHGVGQEAVRLDAAPQRPLGGDQDRIGSDLEGGDAEPVEMCAPGRLIGEEPVRMFGQAGDHRCGERALAHVGQRLGIDDVIVVAGAQQLQEIEAALRVCGAEPGEVRVADLRAEAVRGLVARAGVVHGDPGSASQARRAARRGLSSRKTSWPSISRRTTWRLETAMPSACNCATSRGTVTWP